MKSRVLYYIKNIIFIFIIAFFAFLYRNGSNRLIHSDELSLVFVGLDFFDGNFFLKGWDFSTGLFGLTTIELGIVTILFGYSDYLIYCLAALNYSVMIWVVFWGLQKVAHNVEGIKKYLYILAGVAVILIPRSTTLLNAGTHVLSYALVIFVAFYWYLKSQNRRNNLSVGIFAIVMGIIVVTNSMVLYTFCIPIILSSIVMIYEHKSDEKNIRTIILGVISTVLYLVLKKIWIIGRGETLGGINTVFCGKDAIWKNIGITLCNIAELYGVDVWNKSVISFSAIRAIIGFAIFVKLTIEIYRFIRNKENEKCRGLFYYFLMMAIVNLMAYSFSTIPSYSPDVHLLQPFLLGYTIAGVIAWINNTCDINASNDKLIFIITIIFICIPTLQFSFIVPNNQDRKDAAEWLCEQGYSQGFASFWNAASIMYESKNKLCIAPVIKHNIVELVDDNNLVAYKWMSKREWQEHSGDYIIIDAGAESQFGINEDNIRSTFGAWSEVKRFGDVTVYTFDSDVSLQKY